MVKLPTQSKRSNDLRRQIKSTRVSLSNKIGKHFLKGHIFLNITVDFFSMV